MVSNILFILSACIFCIGCSSKLENADLVDPNEILKVSSAKTVLQADGKDTTIVLARIPNDAGKLDITFTTTAGVFVQSGAKTIKQFADSITDQYRYAKVILKTDTVANAVYVTAETSSARSRIIITFQK